MAGRRTKRKDLNEQEEQIFKALTESIEKVMEEKERLKRLQALEDVEKARRRQIACQNRPTEIRQLASKGTILELENIE